MKTLQIIYDHSYFKVWYDDTVECLNIDHALDAMSEVEKQTRDEMFEFMEWAKDNTDIKFDNSAGQYFWAIGSFTWTNEELFEYWKTNVKNK